MALDGWRGVGHPPGMIEVRIVLIVTGAGALAREDTPILKVVHTSIEIRTHPDKFPIFARMRSQRILLRRVISNN